MLWTAVLPDIAREQAEAPGALERVGMSEVELFAWVADPAIEAPLRIVADIHVDLPQSRTRGIHMSRLYRLLDDASLAGPIGPREIRQLLDEAVTSHRDCATRRANLRFQFVLPARRQALVTAGLSGWRFYPVELEARLNADTGECVLEAAVSVTYSSTCPCSAALTRHRIAQAFSEDPGANGERLDSAQVVDWLQSHATLATPHSQRSIAVIRLVCDTTEARFDLTGIVEAAESALATPVQTAVKRADEQAFAALNGSNLMYVEDAARRLSALFRQQGRHGHVSVRHLESLHPHDAVAEASF